MKPFTIGYNDQNQRLDKFMKKVMPSATPGTVYQSLRKKKVRLNGKRVTDGSLRLSEGDRLELYINDEFFGKSSTPPLWQNLTPRLSVVYEDAHILIMNKPAGMLSQSETEESLETHMRAYLYRKGDFDPSREHTFLPSLCHRIDRNTNGLVIGAKDAESLRILNQKIRDKEIAKFYLCQTEGTPKPEAGELSGWLKKNEAKQKMEPADKDSPGAIFYQTRYRVLRPGAVALVEAELLTGRTHQIRAGFASLGCPLVGDVKYGAKQASNRFQHLTAYRLVFAFTTDAGCINDLNGKEFILEKEQLPCCN